MKRSFFIMISMAFLLSMPLLTLADEPSNGTEVDVTDGDWTDDDDQNIEIEFDDSGVEAVSSYVDVRTVIENGSIVVYSARAHSIPVFDLKGRLIRSLSLEEGRNVVEGLSRGVFIIGNAKVTHL